MQNKRVKKVSDASMLFFVALFVLSQTSNVGSVEVTYWAEVMIEGNKTLNVASLLPDIYGPLDTTGVTITNAEIAAECEIIGRNTTCWCGVDYVWSNFVCDTVNKCCNVDKCVANVSDFTPLCLPKVNVSLHGTVTGSSSTLPITIEPAFRVLNAFNSLITTGSVLTGLNTYQHNFTIALSSVFSTLKVQNIITSLLTNPTFYTLSVRSIGMVHMEAPTGKLCYNSRQQLNCTCVERMDRCSWQMSRGAEFPLTLGPGSEVMLSDICTEQSTVTLLKTNGFWSGTYGCLFTTGNVAHMALAPIEIALLPEVINVTSSPPSADCSTATSASIVITCTIENSTETYGARIKVGAQENLSPTTEVVNGIIKYSAAFSIDCMVATKPRSYDASCTLENSMAQQRNRTIKIPVIYPGDGFCPEEVIETRTWPKTKDNETAVLDCIVLGRQGSYQRKCTGNKWGEEICLCVKAILSVVTLQAADFEKGLGATQEIASLIFQSLRNNTIEESENTFGDVKAAVSVFQTMKSASVNIPLGENLLPNFIESASSMLNSSWDIGDKEETGALAEQYLSSVEGLVQSIRINNTEGYNSSNIQLQICRAGSSCNKTVFGVDVGLNATADMVKTVGLQGLTNRMPNLGFENAFFPSIIVSAQVENQSSPTVNIKMAFPTDESGDMICVFWNFTEGRWSSDGCSYSKNPLGGTCECNHLTSFSMLMSKHPVSMPFLDQLTYIGLGISICSLIVYIIIEILVWKVVVKSSLSHFRHTALINISLCLLLADCSFLASAFPSILNDTLCLILVIAKHYFFLAMFFWMLCLSVMLVHQLIFVFSHIGKKVYMIIGFTVGYIGPTITVAVTYIYYDQATDVPYYSTKTCWLTYQSALVGSIHAFLFPVGTIVLVNLFSMVMVIVTVMKPSGAEAGGKKADKEAAKAVMKVIMFLTPVFGGTWVLGILVFLMDDFTQFTTMFVHYAFTIVNSLQGFFILLTGCFAEKRVRDEILRIIMGKSAKDQASSGK